MVEGSFLSPFHDNFFGLILDRCPPFFGYLKFWTPFLIQSLLKYLQWIQSDKMVWNPGMYVIILPGISVIILPVIICYNLIFGIWTSKKNKNLKFFGLVRDGLGRVRGSFLSNLEGFSKNFENPKIQKLKIDRNTFKYTFKYPVNTHKSP